MIQEAPGAEIQVITTLKIAGPLSTGKLKKLSTKTTLPQQKDIEIKEALAIKDPLRDLLEWAEKTMEGLPQASQAATIDHLCSREKNMHPKVVLDQNSLNHQGLGDHLWRDL